MIRYAADAFQFIISLVVIIVKRFRAVVWKDVNGGLNIMRLSTVFYMTFNFMADGDDSV